MEESLCLPWIHEQSPLQISFPQGSVLQFCYLPLLIKSNFFLSAGEGEERGCGLIPDSSPGQCVQLEETWRSLAVLAGADCNWCFPLWPASIQGLWLPSVSITVGLCPHPRAAVR